MADETACGACGARVLGTDRFCRSCGVVLAGADVEADARKTVVVLFIDLVGSTTLAEQLDPEVLRGVLDRYYKVVSECIAEHLGVVEKYIGDAIMAVFGVPVSREDDAVRAVRAAYTATQLVRRLGAGLRLPGVALDVHCGISAGEAAVITATGAHLRVIGDTVNTAARLQSAAGPGEVLVNEQVADVVRPFVELAAVEPLRLKGKADPVPAWRVQSLQAPAPLDDRARLVGRRAEHDALVSAYRSVVLDRACRQVTVLGTAGMGKSRLVREFTGGAETRDALVLTGRCESYGGDITYQPLASMLLESLPGGWSQVRALFGGADAAADDRRALSCLSSVVTREPESHLPVGLEEIAAAVRGLFSVLARQRPLIVVWEDLHWAEPALLDLIDGLAAWLRDVPVLLVCVARNEFPDLPPGGARIELEPLDGTETRELVAELVAAGSAEVQGQARTAAAEHIAAVCEGNPLFATMMADTLADDRTPAELPPTVSAVLRARVDALPRDERLVLQRAAVCGREFRAGWLRMIAGQDGDTPEPRAALGGLLRRGVLQQVDVDRYRFVQNLLHDTGYAMTAKSSRARWHVALADGLSGVPEAVMYHAEAACLLLREISPGDAALARLSGTAVRLLEAQGTIALHRKDLDAATALLERALALLSPGAARYAGVVLRLTDAYVASGDGERALAVLTAPELSDLGRDDRLTVELQLSTVRLRLGLIAEPDGRAFAADVSGRLAGFPGDDLNWCLRHQFVALLELAAGRTGVAEAELRHALDRARILDDHYSQDRLLGALCELGQWSPTPAADGLRLCAELEERFASDRLLLVPVLVTKARLLALTGDGVGARAAVQQARRHAADLHARLAELAVTQVDALVAGLLGEHATARLLFSTAAAELRELGHPVSALTLEVYAVREILRDGDVASAARALEQFGDDGLEPAARVWLDLLRARLAGDPGLAGEVVETLDSEDPCLLGDAWFEYAEVLRLDGQLSTAAAAAERAIGYYGAKGATLPVETVRSWAAGALR